MGTRSMGRTFDYVPRLVEANNDYLVRHTAAARELAPIDLWNKMTWWTAGAVTDQGSEGACVGHGVTQEAMSSPVRVKLQHPDLIAHGVYRRAQQIDEWEGEAYDGTSVRAGMLVGRDLGWWQSFYWAKNMDELRVALELGPVVIGVAWHESMYATTTAGLVVVEGPTTAGHCLLITGFSPNYNRTGPRFRWRNSWGRSYGLNGNGYIAPNDLDGILFGDGNEAAVAEQQGYGTVK